VVHSDSIADESYGEDAGDYPALEQDPADVTCSSAWSVEDKHRDFARGKEKNRVESKLDNYFLFFKMTSDDTFFCFHVFNKFFRFHVNQTFVNVTADTCTNKLKSKVPHDR